MVTVTAGASITTNSAQEASQWIAAAMEQPGPGVLTPFNHVPDLAPGFGIAYSEVPVRDFATQGNDVYPIAGASGRVGLHKNIWDAIGRGYGIDWPPTWTFQESFGDERDHDPRCCKVTVAGRYRDADGSWKSLPALTKEIDLREGSPEVLKIRADQEYKEIKDLPPDATEEARNKRLAIAQRKADAEINQLRKFIRAHAQTKARLQVIRTLARSSYTVPELQAGPFRIFRVIKNFRVPADRPDLQAKMDDLALRALMPQAEAALFGAVVSTRQLPPVSDEESPPPQEDAGVIAEIQKAHEQIDAEESGSQPSRTCTPDQCHGKQSTAHVKACFKLIVESKAGPPASNWAVPKYNAFKAFTGKQIGEVGDESLFAMRDHYLGRLDVNSDAYADLTDEVKDRLLSEWKEVQREMSRRGLKDDGSHPVKRY
jgi:hypothetical protein